MPATLTDRYIATVVKHLPPAQHADVDAELRSAIADALDAHGGQPDAEAAVLEAMGDPERLAATYADRPLQLIGPRVYLQWKRLTVLLLWIVVPIVAAATALGGVLGDETGWAVVGQTLGAAWVTAVMIVFWVTVVFALIERAGVETVAELNAPWTVDKLPEPRTATVTMGETVASAATLIVTAALLVWQQVSPWVHADDGTGLPIINPDLWSFVLPALLAVMALELAVVIVRQVRGHWSMGDWWLTLGINLAVFALLLPSLLGGTFLNREAFEALGWPDAATTITLENVEFVIAAVVVLTGLSDIISGWLKARRAATR